MGERIGEWEVEGTHAQTPSEWAAHISTTVEVDDADLWVDPAEGALVSVPLPVLAALLRARGWRVEEPGAGGDPKPDEAAARVADEVAAEWRAKAQATTYEERWHYEGGQRAAEEVAENLRRGEHLRGRKG